jgi:fumarate reductase flavoprotein subunit
MSGIRTDKDGAAYGLTGLFSAGEAACWDMHGFNRLGGNSLAETVVAGGIIGAKIAEFLGGHEVKFDTTLVRQAGAQAEERIKAIVSGKNGHEDVYKVRGALQEALMDGCFVFRNGPDLEKCIDTLHEVYERSGRVGLRSNGLGANPELAVALKIRGMVKLGLCIAYGALARTESRGSHTREDYPERNDRDWLNRTLAYWPDGAEKPVLKYEPSSPVYELPPGDRGYGGGKIIPADPASLTLIKKEVKG